MVQLVSLIKDREGRNLSKSAYRILEVIERKTVIEQKTGTSASEIVKELDISTRSIHYSLRRMLERHILERRPFLEDLRQTRYSISENLILQLGIDKTH